ncbi:MAG: hypothetical protein VXW57_05070 [Pseudomonadota bacterium]|nr:hypothetical protein [Pseudomonadota bacterium]
MDATEFRQKLDALIEEAAKSEIPEDEVVDALRRAAEDVALTALMAADAHLI